MGQSKEIKQKWKGYKTLISVSLQCLVTMSKVLLLEGKLGNRLPANNFEISLIFPSFPSLKLLSNMWGEPYTKFIVCTGISILPQKCHLLFFIKPPPLKLQTVKALLFSQFSLIYWFFKNHPLPLP